MKDAKKIDTAIIPIAGLGTRFLPLSKTVPKEFFPLGTKPIIQYIVEEAVEAGIENFIFVISPDKEKKIGYFERDEHLLKVLRERGREKEMKELEKIPNIRFDYVIQKNPKGDGDAILKAEYQIGNKPFLVLFGDDISFHPQGESMATQLVKEYEKVNSILLCLYEMEKSKLSSYGVPQIEQEESENIKKLRDIVEKPKENPPSNFALVGKYILTPKIFSYLKQLPSKNGEIVLADALKKMMKEDEEEKVYGVSVKGEWIECGTKEKWIENFIRMAKN